QYSVLRRDGVPTDWHLMHLGQFAAGGAGLIITEATAVEAIGRISPRDTGIWNDEQAAAWRRITEFVHEQGAPIGVQLAHAGRKASTYAPWGDTGRGTVPAAEGGWPTVGPSAIAHGDDAPPRELTAAEIEQLPATFAAAARRAVDAGFDLVEVHGAHGYLLHQFLSPLANRREDGYGGPLENRARPLLEVLRAVRAEVGDDVPVFVRLSAHDWAPGGLEPEDVARVAGWAKEAGADLADVSSGGVAASQRIASGPGYQVPFAATVRQEAGMPVTAVGLITDPLQIADILESGSADAVMLGRAMLRDPHFAFNAARALGVEIPYWPGQYLRADV
ncbi:MAG TPA: NADH:flavin oxidoreductase/NADH oxidase, partial [Pseudolysinimonas sp.]|nr:NADH:flavin oxidoreductase/NADH oxidase [Pseudolysinimonas sp.]